MKKNKEILIFKNEDSTTKFIFKTKGDDYLRILAIEDDEEKVFGYFTKDDAIYMVNFLKHFING